MDSRSETGARAEDYVAGQLEQRGWLLHGRNLRTPYAEVDLLASSDGAPPSLVVVEVKARHPLAWLRGEELLRPRQRARLGRALLWLVRHHHWGGPRRVDLACVEMLDGQACGWRLIEGVLRAG